MDGGKLVKTVKQVASLLQVSSRFVYHVCATGELESFKIGSRVRITEEALDAYLEAQKKGTPQRIEAPRRSPSLAVLTLRRK